MLGMLRERGTVLEVCPSSNLNTGVLRIASPSVRRVVRALVDGGVRFTVSTDGPEMLRTYLRDELAMLMRHEILSLDEVRACDRDRRRKRASSTARRSSRRSVGGRDRGRETAMRRSPSRSAPRPVYCRPCPPSGGRSGSARRRAA